MAIALNTGMRLSEILALKWEDIDLRNWTIKVRSDEDFTTKGRRNRELPINAFLCGVLRKAPRNITSPHVILTRRGLSPAQAWIRKCGAEECRATLPYPRLDGTTQAEVGEAEGLKLHRGRQDMDTGTDTTKIPDQ